MYKHNESAALYQEEHEKIGQINALMRELYTISAEHSLVPEIDPCLGEWTPEKETGLVDAIRIEEEIEGLEGEIRDINKKRRAIKKEKTVVRKNEASVGGSNRAYKALKPLQEARKDYVIVVAQWLINEQGLAYATVANILGTHERQLREWLGK